MISQSINHALKRNFHSDIMELPPGVIGCFVTAGHRGGRYAVGTVRSASAFEGILNSQSQLDPQPG